MERIMEFLLFISFLGACSSQWIPPPDLTGNDYYWIFNSKRALVQIISRETNPSSMNLSTVLLTGITEDAFIHFSNLTNLDLSQNNLTELGRTIFSKLIDLEELSLANNLISSVDGLFIGLNKLKRLDLSNNMIKILSPGGLFGLTQSVNIFTEGNEIEYLSSRMFQNPSVPSFDLERYSHFPNKQDVTINPIVNYTQVKLCKTREGHVEKVVLLEPNEPFDNCLQGIQVVYGEKRRLLLSWLGLRTFEPHWYTLPADLINELDLSHNLIKEITPELLNHLSLGLFSINLEFNDIIEIRSNVIDNVNLKEFYFRSNYIRTIDDMAFNKTSLTLFHTANNWIQHYNYIKTFPRTMECFIGDWNLVFTIHNDTFRNFKNLKRLILRVNGMQTIVPGAFADQENLIELNLQANIRISELSSAMFEGLKKLKKFGFRNHKVKKISPGTFLEFQNLTDLEMDFEGGDLESIEEGSFSEMHIAKLILSRNHITDDSIAVGAFNESTINYFDLSGNSLTKIKRDIFKGILLIYALDLSENKIKTIEKGDITYMHGLRSLNLSGNSFEQLGNGVFYGLSKDIEVAIDIRGTPVKLIQGGLFDNA